MKLPKTAKISLIFLTSLALLLKQVQSNLICNGDFENYPLTSSVTIDGIYEEVSLIPSDPSCWQTSSCGFVEISKTMFGTGTKSTKLITLLICPISLCQTIALTIGQNYYLSMDVGIVPLLQTATVYAWVNGINVLTVVQTDYRNVTTGYAEFVANASINRVCFNGTASLLPGLTTQRSDYTALLDNIIVDIVSANSSQSSIAYSQSSPPPAILLPSNPGEMTLRIGMTMRVDDIEGIVYLSGDVPVTDHVLQVIQGNVKIFIEGQLQTNSQFYLDESGCLALAITCERSYNLATFQISFPPFLGLKELYTIKIEFSIKGQNMILCFLPGWMIKTVENIQPISEKVLNAVIEGYKFLRSFFFSYFVLNLLNFFTLTLLYNYLNIPTQPVFSHNFLQRLSQILFLQNSLLETLSKIVKNPRVQGAFNFDALVAQGEKIDSFVDRSGWFAKMGVSFNYLIAYCTNQDINVQIGLSTYHQRQKVYPNLIFILFFLSIH